MRKLHGTVFPRRPTNALAADLNFFGDQLIEPRRVAAVLLEAVRLQQFRQKLHRRAEVAADRQLLQCHHHVPATDAHPAPRQASKRHSAFFVTLGTKKYDTISTISGLEERFFIVRKQYTFQVLIFKTIFFLTGRTEVN